MEGIRWGLYSLCVSGWKKNLKSRS